MEFLYIFHALRPRLTTDLAFQFPPPAFSLTLTLTISPPPSTVEVLLGCVCSPIFQGPMFVPPHRVLLPAAVSFRGCIAVHPRTCSPGGCPRDGAVLVGGGGGRGPRHPPPPHPPSESRPRPRPVVRGHHTKLGLKGSGGKHSNVYSTFIQKFLFFQIYVSTFLPRSLYLRCLLMVSLLGTNPSKAKYVNPTAALQLASW